MRNYLVWITSFLVIFFSLAVFAAEKALLLDINGAISPATVDYVQRGLESAQKNHNPVVILKLNTPGGLETAMRSINQAIITSPVPVITYVAPAGARAASAGTFIVYASHLSAMAPGTNIGAASPVNLLATPNAATSKTMSTEEKKATNDAAAYIKSLAELRGKNATWGEQAVRNAVSLSAQEAKLLNVIDDIADNEQQLLQKVDGRTITLHGVPEKLQTKNLQIENMPPDWRFQFLAFITNPNIAYILMLIAMYGLFFEFSNPGLILPGIVGVIALFLVLYAFQLMPINYAGLALISIGIIFMIIEVIVQSFGIIGIGGVIAFILGSVMLFDIHDPNYHIAIMLIIGMSILTLAFFFLMLTLAIRAHRKKIVTGREGLIGMDGVVLSTSNNQIIVRVFGEIWEAKSSHRLHTGQSIKVEAMHGLVLTVRPIDKPHQAGDS